MNTVDFEKLFENGEHTAETKFVLSSGCYDGRGATVNAPFGVEIIASDVILKNLKVNGRITVLNNVSDVIIEGCEARMVSIAVSTERESTIKNR